jgi:hypothetical protein
MKFPAIVIGLMVLVPAAAAASEPCRDAPNGKALDFWIGDWTVTAVADGAFQGTSRIESVLGGCAVIENWHEDGGEGKSLFAFDARSGLWNQTWVTEDTSRPGGLKTKALIAAGPGGDVRFQGTIFVAPGVTVLDRTTLTPLKDGRVRQTIEISRDGGTTWKANFDAYYTHKSR